MITIVYILIKVNRNKLKISSYNSRNKMFFYLSNYKIKKLRRNNKKNLKKKLFSKKKKFNNKLNFYLKKKKK